MTDETWRLANLYEDLTNRFPADHGLTVVFENCAIRVVSNSEALTAPLAAYYRPFVRDEAQVDITITAIQAPPPILNAPFAEYPREHPDKALKEEYADLPDARVIRKVRTGMHFLFNTWTHLAVGDCLSNINQVVNFINSRYAEFRLARGGLLLHAAGVAWEHQGLALVGRSGLGKSTLALHMVERGFDFISNDRLIVDRHLPGIRMFGLPKQPRVNPGTLLSIPHLESILPERRRRELSELACEKLWKLEEKHDVDVAELYGADRMALVARLSAIIVLNWSPCDAPVEINQIDLNERRDLLGAMMKSRGVFASYTAPEVEDPDPGEYLNALRGCPTYEISGGVAFEEVVEHFTGKLTGPPACAALC